MAPPILPPKSRRHQQSTKHWTNTARSPKTRSSMYKKKELKAGCWRHSFPHGIWCLCAPCHAHFTPTWTGGSLDLPKPVAPCRAFSASSVLAGGDLIIGSLQLALAQKGNQTEKTQASGGGAQTEALRELGVADFFLRQELVKVHGSGDLGGAQLFFGDTLKKVHLSCWCCLQRHLGRNQRWEVSPLSLRTHMSARQNYLLPQQDMDNLWPGPNRGFWDMSAPYNRLQILVGCSHRSRPLMGQAQVCPARPQSPGTVACKQEEHPLHLHLACRQLACWALNAKSAGKASIPHSHCHY